MKKRTYRRKLTYVPHTCSDGTAYWSLYIGHRYVKHCGSKSLPTAAGLPASRTGLVSLTATGATKP